jgi:HTH-type transcriptional regulator / antitoxin HigA
LATNPEDVRLVPSVLASIGIRLVIVQHLQGTKIDAAAMWLNESSPVIAMSMRFGRIDNFWHNLFHEIIHIKYRDDPVIDIAMNDPDDRDDGGDIELRANLEAAEALIPKDKMESFIARHKPLFYQAKVIQFAGARGVHPGIAVGQLHRRGELDYKQLRKLLVDVRQYLIGSALTDGWGDCPVIA